MPRASKVCSTPGCPHLTDKGRCAECRSQAERERGSASQRGYGGSSWESARKVVLARDPRCVCLDGAHDHAAPCGAPSAVADHYPHERKDLVAAGVPDPDAPHRMRGVCMGCHNKKTGTTRPGGWAAR